MHKQKGIAFVSYYGDLGGGELRMLEHLALTRLPRDRASVVVLEPGPFADRLRSLGICVREIPWSLATPRPARWFRSAGAAMRVMRHLRWRNVGVVYCNTYNDLRLVGPLAKVLRLPVIWRSRAEVFPFFPELSKNEQQDIVGMITRTVSRALTTTKYDRDLMVSFGVPAERVYVVSQGVKLTEYLEAQVNGKRLRERLTAGSHGTLIGFVARMVPQKGHAVFFEALAQVIDKRPEVRALVVGDAAADGADPDGFRSVLKDQVAALGLSQKVIFTGFRDDIPAVMNAIDLFVHASLKEPFGHVVVEAMAAGVPVIASKTPGPQEIIADGITGLLTPPGDVGALAASMNRLLEHRDLARDLGRRGRDYVEREYNLQNTIEQLDCHIIEVLEERRLCERSSRLQSRI